MRGGQHQVLLLLDGLTRAGHECLLLARDDSPLYEQAAKSGFRVETLSISQLIARSRGVDLVHAHDAHSHTLASLWARNPFVVSRRVAFPVKQTLPSRWKYSRPKRYLAVSQFVANELKRVAVDSSKIDIVHDAVADGIEQVTWNPDHPAVALATKDPEKGRDLIERAASEADIPVVFSEDILTDFPRASMFVYISRSEGFGSAALLAMASGVPVIASRIGGMVELFEDRVGGLFTSNSPADIAKTMRLIRDDESLSRKIIENALARVREKFSMDQLVSGTLTAYKKALDV